MTEENNIIQEKQSLKAYIFKVIIIGGQNVGKSSLLLRYVDGKFADQYEATIGIDFKTKNLKIDDTQVKLQIWDTAGQERFSSLAKTQYKGSHACMVVYDIASRKSFTEAEKYLQTALNETNIDPQSVYLVANKQDLIDQVEISNEEGNKLAHNYNVYFCETSAKNNVNVEGAFTNMAHNLIKQIISQNSENQNQNQKQNQELDLESNSIQLKHEGNQIQKKNCQC